jgi:lipopolysaccharide/colanic/teichoic acid biosynthesis glycosyltransferase
MPNTNGQLKEHVAVRDGAHRFRGETGLSAPDGAWPRYCKRVTESLLAGLGLLATAPIGLLAAALVKLTSRGPAFYTQVRMGRNGRPFTIYKLRTMHHDCERLSGARWSTPGDPRITPIGRVLRRTHLDELPQLWNVVKGDMSLIGPRPERPEFVPQLEQVIPHYRDRLLVRPGMTGLAQIQLPADTDLASVRRKLAHDLHYVRHVSFFLDFKLLLHTACYLLGVPFALVNELMPVPTGWMVEDAYHVMTKSAPPLPPPQPLPSLQTA